MNVVVNSIKHLVVVGVGLIGGSLSLALKRAGVVQRVTGVGRSRENLELASDLGVIDDWTHDIAEAVRDADMVLLAVPMGAYDGLFKAMADALPAHAIVTDAGSTKQSAMVAAQQCLPNPARFVAAHPIAGTEHSGAAAAFAELFEDHLCILTPDDQTDVKALAAVKGMWEATGCHIREMDAADHDDALAGVSHLPHLAAFALVNAVRRQAGDDPFQFAAGGFRDFTRIASSSPQMWRDIALCNKQALMGKIDALQHELAVLREALEAGDGERLLHEFESAKQARDTWVNKGKK
jgi:prephenate dehydrogenase